MGWFTDWLDKDKSEKEDTQQTEKTTKSIENIFDKLLKNSVAYKDYAVPWKDVVWFKTKDGSVYQAGSDCFDKYMGRESKWKIYPEHGSEAVKGLCLDGITHLNSKENYEAFLESMQQWIESGDGMFFVDDKSCYRLDNRTIALNKSWFKEYMEGFIFRGTPSLKLRTISETQDYSKLKTVVDELVRMKLTGDVEILEKGYERSILLKEYFDHSWIDIGLKGTLFVQDLDTHEATSWSDVNVKRENLSSLVECISDILSYEDGVQLKPEEADLIKDVKHYVNKAKELIGEAE